MSIEKQIINSILKNSCIHTGPWCLQAYKFSNYFL